MFQANVKENNQFCESQSEKFKHTFDTNRRGKMNENKLQIFKMFLLSATVSSYAFSSFKARKKKKLLWKNLQVKNAAASSLCCAMFAARKCSRTSSDLVRRKQQKQKAGEKKHQTLYSREHQYVKIHQSTMELFMPFIFIWIQIHNNFQFHMRRHFLSRLFTFCLKEFHAKNKFLLLNNLKAFRLFLLHYTFCFDLAAELRWTHKGGRLWCN